MVRRYRSAHLTMSSRARFRRPRANRQQQQYLSPWNREARTARCADKNGSVRRVLTLSAACLLALSALIALSRPTSTGASVVQSSSPCGHGGASPHYSHVAWIVLENVGYPVTSSRSAPYLSKLANECGLATNYDAISHPSLPNYIAMTSGATYGISDDAEPSAHRLNVNNLFSELRGNWRGEIQSMPSACDRVTSGAYAARHNPAVYYINLGTACAADDLPLSFPLNLSSAFTMIIPNICDDMHSCSVGIGDSWLSHAVPDILSSKQYQSGSLVLFITFDENENQSPNHVPTYVIAPSVPTGLRVSKALNHYSLLRTIETLLGVPLLAGARGTQSMISPFHL